MKYSELPEKQAKALMDLYLRAADAAAQEQRAYSIAGFQLLLVGNGAGVVILANILAKLYESKAPHGGLILPFIIFIVGVVCAGLAYLPVIDVSSNAARHVAESIEKLIKDEVNLEDLHGWGHNKFTLSVLWIFISLSFLCFISGMVLVTKAIW